MSFMINLSKSIQDELNQIARILVTPGKGIFAVDESVGTIGKKFTQILLENTKENRKLYRQMLLSNDQIQKYISGVILHEETVYQKNDEGKTFIEMLTSKSIVPGIKVDKGLVTLLGTNSETTTQGLDDLKARCEEYYKIGCRFAKWRAVLKIGDQGEPTPMVITENARGLARYASICQECRIVPIVEPEVLQDGKHSLEQCQKVSQRVLAATIQALHDYNVLLEGILLKTNMITAGHECVNKSSSEEIGLATVTTLFRTVPPAIPGIIFLSGGQSEEEATVNLNQINIVAIQSKPQTPWILSFSYGRALQQSAITVWDGKRENNDKAHQELLKRMKANSMACQGKYVQCLASSMATKSNFVSKHFY